MIAQKSKLAQWTHLLLVLPVGLSGYAQGTLINSNTRNGSFEDGVLAPWGGYPTLTHDASFASEGEYYATYESSGVRPVFGGENLQPNPEDGLLFLLSFDARVGTPGLNVVSVSMGARTPTGQSLSASVMPLMAPPLTTTSWQSYSYQFQMPAIWGNDGVSLGISFSKNQPLNGITHYAYLDNIILQQIPEPSVFALSGLGAFLWVTGLLHSRRNAFGK